MKLSCWIQSFFELDNSLNVNCIEGHFSVFLNIDEEFEIF